MSSQLQPPDTDAEGGVAGHALRARVEAGWLRLRERARADAAPDTLGLRARTDAAPHILALCTRVPELDPLDRFLASSERDRFFWAQPADKLERAAVGCIADFEIEQGDGAAAERFERAGRQVAAWLDRLEVIGDAVSQDALPGVHAGFAYAARAGQCASARGSDGWSSYPAARLVLARSQVTRSADGCFECRLALVGPDSADDGWQALFEPWPASEPACSGASGDSSELSAYTVRADRPHARYEAGVDDALEEIGRGDLEKVVLARALDVVHEGRFGMRQFVDQLRNAYPSCTTFVVARDDDHFVSASPERLVSLDGQAVRTSALAGSAPRGRTPESDLQLGEALMACPKNAAEHDAVRRSILAALGELACDVVAAERPSLRKLAGIQHLETTIEATLSGRDEPGHVGESLLRLVAALHPTPAVGGLPKAAADAWISAHEDLDRGWYAAPVGWINVDGSGEFRVALRSALLRTVDSSETPRSTARLFAGAGIVAGSDPHDELVETRIKLRTLLAPLTEI